MTAEEYLQQYQKAKHRIERLTWTIKELKSMAEGTPFVLDGLPHGSGMKSPMETFACEAIDKENELKDKIKDAEYLLVEIEETINEVSTPELSDLLFFRYIQNLQWTGSQYFYNKSKSPYIADKLGYDERHCRRLHLKALEEVQKIIDKRTTMSDNVRLN